MPLGGTKLGKGTIRPPRRPASGVSGANSNLPSNVIDMAEYRSLHTPRELPVVYYLTGKDETYPQLAREAFFRLIVVGSEEELKTRLLSHAPDLILLDSDLSWAGPIPLIEWLTRLVEAPIVMLTAADAKASQIKEAFAAGLHDTLYTPLQDDELSETLDVLLKLRRHASLQP